MLGVKTLFVCAALLLALPAAGAAQTGDQEPLRIALNGFENNLTPFTLTFGSSPNTHDLIMLVHDSLFWSQVREDPEPWLAERAEPNDDFTEWTVTLREGVTWHDGEPLTAEDVKFSFEYYVAQEGASGRYAHHVSDVPPFEAAEVVDDRTVRLTFAAPAPAFEIMPGADLPIIPQHVWEGIADPRTASEMLPVGSGPYKLVEIRPDQLYRFEANEDYFKGKPTVDVLELPIVKDPAAAFAALRTGEVAHVTRSVPAELADQFTATDDIEIAESTRFESTQLFFNARKPPLDDARLRKAIAMAVDRQALVDTVLLRHGRPGLPTFLHPDSPWAVEDAEPDHDPEAAQALLDEAGYAEGADGVRTAPDGTPLEFSVLVSSFEPQDLRAVQLMAQQVAPLGVRLNPEALDPATLRQRRQAPPGEVPGYDAYVSVLESHAHVDPDALYYFFHSPGPKGFGAAITGYTNPQFDALAEEATTAEVEERKRLDAELQQILAADAPAIVLWYRDGEWAYRPADYDGWLPDPGQGIFTKRSFLPEYAEQGQAADAEQATAPGEADPDTESDGQAAEGEDVAAPAGADDAEPTSARTSSRWWLIALLVLAAVLAVVLLRRRREPAYDEDE
jgi:peptide/nickel transport system substrate-binding protein